MYKIVRHYLNRPQSPRTIRTGLTLQEAVDWEASFEGNSNTCKSRARKATTKKSGPWYDRYALEDDNAQALVDAFDAVDIDLSDDALPIVIGNLIQPVEVSVAFNPNDPWEDEITQEIEIPQGLIDVCKGNGQYIIGLEMNNGEPIVIGYEEA